MSASAPDRERFEATGHGFVEDRGAIPLEDLKWEYDRYIELIARFRPLDGDSHLLEVGAGTGWFEILCAKDGLRCTGLELSPINAEFAHGLAREHGVEIDMQLGNIEEVDLGSERYDAILAPSVFEHVQHYGRALARIYEALKPGGVFYFYSTNKFSPVSGEYPGYPLYGWLPYSVRKRIRIRAQGPGIVASSGIDFNQFTYWGLRRHFESLGFSRVMDRVDFQEPRNVSPKNAIALRAVRAVPPLKTAARAFATGNTFVCVK